MSINIRDMAVTAANNTVKALPGFFAGLVPGYIKYMTSLFAISARKTRLEFWPYFAFNLWLMLWLPEDLVFYDFFLMYFILCIPPMCQRMNDLGFPKKWLFVQLIPGIGQIVTLAWMCAPSMRRVKVKWNEPYVEPEEY